MSEYTMQVWGVVYTAVDANDQPKSYKDGTPVLYFHPHDECENLADGCDFEEFRVCDGLRLKKEMEKDGG